MSGWYPQQQPPLPPLGTQRHRSPSRSGPIDPIAFSFLNMGVHFCGTLFGLKSKAKRKATMDLPFGQRRAALLFGHSPRMQSTVTRKRSALVVVTDCRFSVSCEAHDSDVSKSGGLENDKHACPLRALSKSGLCCTKVRESRQETCKCPHPLSHSVALQKRSVPCCWWHGKSKGSGKETIYAFDTQPCFLSSS